MFNICIVHPLTAWLILLTFSILCIVYREEHHALKLSFAMMNCCNLGISGEIRDKPQCNSKKRMEQFNAFCFANAEWSYPTYT